MVKKIVILLCICLAIGCQDTKRKHANAKENKQKTHKKEAQTIKEPMSTSEKYGLDTITKLKQTELIPFLKKYGEKNPETQVRIKTDFGDIEVELFEDTPLHRANFIRMAKLGYFNTTYFYRVVKGFVIQAGNSDNPIMGRFRKRIGKYLIPKEFSDKHLHEYGAFSAAKYTKQNVSKASSPYEFFIVMNKDGAPHLNNDHTVFGKVTKGMEVAEKIANEETESNSEWPVDDVNLKVEVIK